MTSNYLAMLVMFAHLAIKERLISSNFFSERERQVTTAIRNEWLTKQIIQKENILFMFYHIHGTFKFTEYYVYVSSQSCDIYIWGVRCSCVKYLYIFVLDIDPMANPFCLYIFGLDINPSDQYNSIRVTILWCKIMQYIVLTVQLMN
jgi:hypothetical protein